MSRWPRVAQVRGLADRQRSELLLQMARQAKAGGIGTSGKAALALRFDDGQDAFKATVYPLLTARGLPCSLATVSAGPAASQAWWTAGTTWADWLAWNRNGCEIWSHGFDHRDPTPQGNYGLERDIVESKASLEARGVRVQGYAQPGVTPLTGETPFGPDNLTTLIPGYQGYAGQLLQATYALSEAYGGGIYRGLPHGVYHGLDHITISDGITLADITARIDEAITYGLGLEMMVHPHNLGAVGKLSVADFTTVLDYIVTKWEAGLAEVLTPSGLCFADAGSTRRQNLIGNGDIEGITIVGTVAGMWANVVAGVTIGTATPHGGTQFFSFANTVTGLARQIVPRRLTLNQGGETWLFEGWARSNGTTTQSRVLIQDYDDNTRLSLSLTRSGIGTSWTRVRHAFTTHPLTDRILIGIGRNSGDGIDWDDISVKKV